MAESKKINLGKFFRQDSASPSGVRVRDEKGIIPQAQVVMSGRDLSGIIDLIKSTTEITTDQEQLIRTEDKNDNLLQGIVNNLQQRIFGLQSSLTRLRSEFEKDLLDRQRQAKSEKRRQFAALSEGSKGEMVKPLQKTIGDYQPYQIPYDEEGSGGSDVGKGSLFGAAAGLTAAGMSSFLGNEKSESGGSYSSGTYDAKKLTELAKSVGMPEDKIPTMVAIALGESGGKTDAHNPDASTGDDSYGLWQINMIGSLGESRRKEFGIKSNEELKDPTINAKAALSVLNSQGLSAWTVYKEGIYKDYMPETEKAYGEVKSAESTSTPPSPATPKAEASAEQSGAQAQEISAAPQAPDDIAKEERTIASSVQPRREGGAGKGGLELPPEVASSAAPIIIPINKKQPTVANLNVSAGESIPGGITENLNNFYPALSRAVLGIMA